jgi:hypothetical protein
MASLTAKVVRGRTYCYLRECERVQGMPKTPGRSLCPDTGQAPDGARLLLRRCVGPPQSGPATRPGCPHRPTHPQTPPGPLGWPVPPRGRPHPRRPSHQQGATVVTVRKQVLGWTPMFHWADSKIRVPAFTCVLALLLSSLLQRTLHQQGVPLSIPRLFGSWATFKKRR